MKILIAGASGLIGRATAAALADDGHEVMRLVRRAPASPDEVSLESGRGRGAPRGLPLRATAIVNLCGARLAGGAGPQGGERRSGRAGSTRRARSQRSSAGTISDGPAAAGPRECLRRRHLRRPGQPRARRVERAREGVPGGALPRLGGGGDGGRGPRGARRLRAIRGRPLPRRAVLLRRLVPFYRAGLGARSAAGRQWMSWISLEDAVGVIRFAVREDWLSGPVNAVSPMAVMNSAFTRALGRIFGRQLSAPVPAVRAAARDGCRSPTRRVLVQHPRDPGEAPELGLSVSGTGSWRMLCTRRLPWRRPRPERQNHASHRKGPPYVHPFQWRRPSSSLSRTAWRSGTSETCSTASRRRVSRSPAARWSSSIPRSCASTTPTWPDLPFYPEIEKFMSSRPVIVMALEGHVGREARCATCSAPRTRARRPRAPSAATSAPR